MDKTIGYMAIFMASKNNCYGETSKTIVMSIWIKQFYGDSSKTILMAIRVKQFQSRFG